MRARRGKRSGFTLVEVLLALSIFTLVTSMAAAAFWAVMKAWNRGGEMLEQLHYGDYAMEQLVSALRGAAWFPSKPAAFGFQMESGKAVWTTSGTAFLPPDSHFRNGLHRMSVTVDTAQGERGLVVRAWPHLAEEDGERDAEAWLVCPEVDEFSCEWYDFDVDAWSQDWEETNSLPKLIRVTLTMKKRENFDESLELQRLVELEVAPELPGRERRDRTTTVRPGGGDSAGEGGEGGEGKKTADEGSDKPTIQDGGQEGGQK